MSALFAAWQAIWAALRFAIAGGAAAELDSLRREIGGLRVQNAALSLANESLTADLRQARADMEVVRANLEDIQRAGSGAVTPADPPGAGDGARPGADAGGDHAVLGRLRDGTFGT
jgi:hypothetical protein